MSSPEPAQQKKHVAIEIPKDLEPVYSNIAFISHTAAEIILDFALVLPRMPKGQVVSRVIMSPTHAKMLQNALATNVSNYERQFGEIRLPQQSTLADNLFRFPPGQSPDDEPEKE